LLNIAQSNLLNIAQSNLLNIASLAFGMVKGGGVSSSGSTSLLLGRSLKGLRDSVDGSLAAFRLGAGLEQRERLVAASLTEDAAVGALIQAHSRGAEFTHTDDNGDVAMAVDGDRQTLLAALAGPAAGRGPPICLQAAEVSGGALSIRDLQGKGCVFTLELTAGELALKIRTELIALVKLLHSGRTTWSPWRNRSRRFL